MKKLLTLLLVLVCSVGFAAGTTTETSGKSTVQTGPATFTDVANIGWTQLGDYTTQIKVRVVEGTTAALPNGVTTLPSSLASPTVLFVTAGVLDADGNSIPPHDPTAANSYQVVFNRENGAAYVVNGSASVSINSRPVAVTIFYRKP